MADNELYISVDIEASGPCPPAYSMLSIGACLVGDYGAFDWAFVNWYFHTYLGRNPFGIGPIDIKAYFMGLKGGSWEDTRSSRIPERFKGTAEQTHNALDD